MVAFEYSENDPIRSYVTAYNSLAHEVMRIGKQATYVIKDMITPAQFVDLRYEWHTLVTHVPETHVQIQGTGVLVLVTAIGRLLNDIAEELSPLGVDVSIDKRDHLMDGEYTLYVTDIMKNDIDQINKMYEAVRVI